MSEFIIENSTEKRMFKLNNVIPENIHYSIDEELTELFESKERIIRHIIIAYPTTKDDLKSDDLLSAKYLQEMEGLLEVFESIVIQIDALEYLKFMIDDYYVKAYDYDRDKYFILKSGKFVEVDQKEYNEHKEEESIN